MQVRFLSDAFTSPCTVTNVILKEPLAAFCVLVERYNMQKDKLTAIRDYIVRHCKIVFPVLLIAVVAVTVAVALGARREKAEAESLAAESSALESSASVVQEVQEDIPLEANEDSDIYTLLATYYNAVATGDTETILAVCSEYSDNELLRVSERAKYLDYYPTLDIYTKPGPEDGSSVAYVYYKLVFLNHEEEVPGFQAWYICRNEDGGLYINTGELSTEVNDYITKVSTQADVVELYNRVQVEYNEVLTAHSELLTYMQELSTQVNTAVGTTLAKENASEEGQIPEESQPGSEAENGDTPQEETPVESGPQYATATTTVNVRSSDSEQADKLGKVSGGTRVEVQEVRVNGWTKIVYEGKDGYIKSEYLQMAESAAGQNVIGTVTATTNINVRSAGSETAERLGVLTGGESLDLLANEDGWCKVKYNGQVGYVKADYVTQQ